MNTTIRLGDFRAARAADGPEAEALLTPEERVSCDALPERCRDDYRAGCLAAKRAASKLLSDFDPARICIRAGRDRRPSVAVLAEAGQEETHFTVSIDRCDGRAVAAVSDGMSSVGVDIEPWGRLSSQALRHLLGKQELEDVRREAGAMDATTLLAIKAAAWKALDLPTTLPLKALQMVFDRGELVELRYGGQRWIAHARRQNPWWGYVSCVVWAYPMAMS